MRRLFLLRNVFFSTYTLSKLRFIEAEELILCVSETRYFSIRSERQFHMYVSVGCKIYIKLNNCLHP